MDFDCFVINLDRQPERYAHFVRVNSLINLPIERFAALDGTNVSDAVRAEIAAPDLHFTPGAIGAALSHRALWQRTLLTGRPALILEDDVHLRKDVASVLPGIIDTFQGAWDVLLLGFNTDVDVRALRDGKQAAFRGYPPFPSVHFLTQFVHSRDPVSTFPLIHAFGLCAYLVTSQAAARLLDLCFPMRPVDIRAPYQQIARVIPFGIDGMANAVYDQLRAFVCIPALAMAPNDQATSTTVGLGQKLAELMRKQQLTVADAARRLEVRPAEIERWLREGMQTRFSWDDGPARPGLRRLLQRWIDVGTPPTPAELRAIAVIDATRGSKPRSPKR